MRDIQIKISEFIAKLVADRDIIGYLGTVTPVEIKDEKGTAYTDGKTITFTKNFAIENKANLEFVLLHEMLHIYMEHFSRRGNRDRQFWNIATDFEINQTIILNNYIKFKEIIDAKEFVETTGVCLATLKDEIPELEPNMTAEKVYELLLKYKDKIQKNSNDMKQGDGNGNGSSSRVKIGNKEVTVNDVTKVKGEQSQTKANIQKVTQRAKAMGSNSVKILEKIKLEGQRLDQVIRLLRKYIRRYDAVIGSRNGYRTYTRKNRIFSHLPGVKKSDTQLKTLVVVIDESASIQIDDIKNLVGSIKKTLDKDTLYIKNLIIIHHDVDIIVDENADFIDYERKLSGGTSHKKVFQYLNENKKDKNIVAAIFLTDTESDILACDMPKDIFRIWIVPQDVEKPQVPAKDHVIKI